MAVCGNNSIPLILFCSNVLNIKHTLLEKKVQITGLIPFQKSVSVSQRYILVVNGTVPVTGLEQYMCNAFLEK